MLTKKGFAIFTKVMLVALASLLFMTCDPGLGKAVDTQDPKVSIEFPQTKSVLKGGFTIKGIASDEVKVASCVVTFKNIKTTSEKSFTATVEGDNFSVSINPQSDGLPDGDYNVTVTVSDAYRNSKADVVYTIDNTAPTVLITSPNSYSESNWPNMYRTFNIKGEVYDATNLESVTVYLVDEFGEILKEQIAEGTNTFTANFDNPFYEEKECFYYAVAKDAGGNVNTYCYHSSDIRKLLATSAQHSETPSFPSINSIGYVDQGKEKNLTELIDKEQLKKIKIDNNKAEKKADSFPGLKFFAQDTAQVKWLNVSKENPDSISGIAIGSPVLGTIMPPTDQSAIDYSSISVWVAKSADGTSTNFEPFTEENKLEVCVIKEGEEGDKQVKLTAVGESLNFQINSNPGNNDNWQTGYYKAKIYFKTDSNIEGSDECRFEVTSGAPKLSEGNFAKGKDFSSYYRGYMTAKTVQNNEAFLGGKATSSDGSKPVELKYDCVGTKDVAPGRITPESDGTYKINIQINAQTHENDGEYTYTLTAAPDSTLTTVISRVVVIDTTNPSVSFGNISDGEILGTDDFTVKGSIEDANGIEKVEYLLQENGVGNTWSEIPNAKSSFNFTLSNLKEDVDYTLKIRATDVAGNINGDDDYKCNFTIDLSNPVATIDSPAPESGSSIYFTNEVPVFSGKATDNEKTAAKIAKEASLSYSKDGGAFVNIEKGTEAGKFNWNQQSGTWTWNPTNAQFNGTGKYDVKLVVTDNANKTSEDSLTVSLDATVPTIKLTQVSSYVERSDVQDDDSAFYVNGTITVKFDISENDYIKSIEWYKPDGSKDSQSLGTNAQPTVTVNTTQFADGVKLSEFKLVVTDRSGNKATYTGNETELVEYEINQASDLPSITIEGIDQSVKTENEITADKNLFSTSSKLTITLSDDDGVKTASYQIDSNSATNISCGNLKEKTEPLSFSNLSEGPHKITVTVKDIHEKSNSITEVYFGIDNGAPVLNINGYTGTDIDAGHKTSDFEITGTATDSYAFGTLETDDSSLNIQGPDTNGNWILEINKPNSSEKKTIKFVATDKFLRTTVKSFTYIFDLDKPNLTINEDFSGKFFNQNYNLTLTGESDDLNGDIALQSGLKYVQYGIGTGHNAASVNSAGWQNAIGKENWTITLDMSKYSDGAYTLFVKSEDYSGNESAVQKFNITADSNVPILTEGGSADASGTSYASGTLNLQGTVSDSNLDTITYTYSLNGNNQEVDVPISPVGNSAEKTWSITKSDLGDGTHIFKIIATDKAGNSSVITRNIIIDKTAPEITTNVSPQIMYNNGSGEELTVNGEIDVNIRVAETNKLKGVYYTFKNSGTLADNADWSAESAFNENDIAVGKTIKVDTTKYSNKTKLPLRVKAIDEAGNYKIENINPVINQESDKPGFVPSNFVELNNENAAGWKAGTSYNVFSSSSGNLIFTLSDDDSVKEYFVKVDNGDFVKISEINSTQKIVSYSLENLIKNGNYGRHTITFIVKDVNCADNLSTQNNFVEKTYYIAIDDGQPSLIISNANNQYVGNNFTISGSVEDANGVEKVTIAPLTGSSFTPIEITSFTDGNDGDKIFTYNFAVPTERVPLVITAVDSIGNESVKELTYLVDNQAPIISITSGDSAYVDGDYPSLRITGMAEDGDLSDSNNSGIDQVRIKIEEDITGVNDSDSILALGKIDDGNMSWSSSIDFTGKTAGSYKVYVKAFDLAGNESTSSTITVYVDTDKPKLNHGYVDNFVGNYKGNFVITGTATDASGVKSVTAKIQGATNNLVGTYTETSDSSESNWSFNIPSNVGDGQLTILVTALDGCGKSVQETFTATLDTLAPSVTFTDISDDDGNNTTIETSKTTDKPRVSVTYADSTSGVKNIGYTFYYYYPNVNISGLTPDADGFIDYSKIDDNAKGSFERSESYSGTVVMKMAESTGSKGPFVFTDSDTDGKWYVKVTVTDVAENEATYKSPYFYVDQHKPELEVTSPAQNVNLKKQNDALEVTGTTSDSYGGDIDKVVVKIYHTSYNESQQANFTKTFTKDGSNGTKILTKNGESYQFTYTWDSANSPFIYPDVYEIFVTSYDKAGNTKEFSQKISCDNTAPTISFARPYSYSVDAFGNVNEGIVVNSPIGDTSIKALADDYSMASIYYQIGGTVDIEATGSIGSSNYKITKLTVENGGVGTDTYGTSVTDVKLDDVNIALAGNWNKLTSANLDFDVEYNTLNMVNAGKTYHADGDKETIQTLDVHFVAVDKAGNINYCKYPLKVDTDTDKPTLLMLSPKTINDVANVGGTATISGTVNDDNAVHSVWMQVELVNGNYNGNVLSGFTKLTYGITEPQVLVENIVDGKPTYSSETTGSYFADRTKWYKVNLGAENSTSTTWNMMLNKNGEFDIAKLKESGSLPNNDALKQTELLIKVKALDTKANDGLSISSDAKAGDSTEFRLIIDSGSPSIIFNNIADFPAEGSYIGGNITFDLEFSDDQSITEWKLEAISTASGDNRSMLIASGKYSGTYDVGMGKTVKPVADGKYVGSNGIITVDTADIYAQCGNLIQFKISAKDNSKDPQSRTESPKESYLTFKYTIDNSAPDASLVSTIDSKSYYIDTESVIGDNGAHRETIARGNHLRIMSDQAAFTGKVFDEANGSGIDYVMLYFTKGNRLYNPSEVDSSFEISNHLSVKDKDGNSVSPLSPVGSLKDVVRTSGTSNPYIIVDRAEGMLDSGANGDLDGYDENLKANGDWVVYIKSSNLPDGIYDIHYVVVDFAGNARYYSDTMLVQNYAPTINSIVLATDIDGDGQASIGNDDKGDEYQKFVTGEFTSTYFNVRNSKLKIKVNVTGGTGELKYFLKCPNLAYTMQSSTGVFEVNSFPGDSSTPVNYVVWVEDSVEENLSLSSGETTIDMIMDNEDDVAPVAQFFELNTIVEDSKTGNKDRGSLYNGSGHIEPRGNSPFGNTDGKDPDVSGTIILRGEVFDNQRINYIALNLNGIETPIAQWSENSLKVSDDEIVNIVSKLGLNGHYVEWSYAWDTNSIVAENVNISVIVKDASGKTNTESSYDNKNNIPRTTENMYSRENWGYNKMTVDVVPFITAVYRNGSYNTNRAKSGAYPMLRGQEKNCIEGFNLGTDVSKISVVITENKDGSGYSFTMGSLTKSGTSTAFTVTSDSKDGYLSTVVNGIRSINNLNDNSHEYNRESNSYDSKTALWTDDRYVRIWQNKSSDYFPGSTNPVYPAMSIGNTGDLYASFSNYSTASVYYSRYGGSGTGTVFKIYDPPEETDICVTGEDKLNIAFAGNYHNGGSNSWVSDASLSGGIYVYDSASTGKYNGYKFNKHELYYHNKMLQQFKNMRVKRKSSDRIIHLVYFDRITSSIHYSNSRGDSSRSSDNTKQTSTSAEYSWVNIDGGTDGDDYAYYFDGNSTYIEDSKGTYDRFEDTERCAGTGESAGLALTNSGYPVVVYFDASNKVLKLARALRENPKNSDTTWWVQDIKEAKDFLGVSVEAISCEIDSSGYLHIAFQNGKNQLIYIKSTNTSDNGSTRYTFETPVVVAEGVSWVDLTLYGSTPYISFLSGANSYDGLNLAFFDKTIDTNFDGGADGSWEVMVAPLAYKATSIRTCVEVHPQMTTSDWEAAIGFTPGDLYRVALYIGSGKGH